MFLVGILDEEVFEAGISNSLHILPVTKEKTKNVVLLVFVEESGVVAYFVPLPCNEASME